MQVVITLVLCCLLSVVANGQTITVVTEASPPYHYLDKDGNVSGVATDQVKEILEEANINGEFMLYPWARAYDKAIRHPNTLIYSMAKTSERDKAFYWIAKVSQFNLAVVGLADKKETKAFFADEIYQQHTFAVQRDDISYRWLIDKGLREGEELLVCADIHCSWSYLLRGVVDFIIEDPALIGPTAKEMDVNPAALETYLMIPELAVDGYLAVNKKMDPVVVAQLKDAAQQLGFQSTSDDEIEARR
ncbi:transporter substrate-binding domain-containing protein [Alteromonas sp. C1M14]|uniref:substrate-binding periplasmic protein n=1 Tax=Alteromonas sp. C1M14 TaxID=2841567 RepID=UPI001C08EC39|nr:transporter substrate-binding domain-containing protein [Alteromonas sp. C1M14]MBU2979806.1 transporter substrate-binding domain-containing protein [Alteromonas sp. C1M14]